MALLRFPSYLNTFLKGFTDGFKEAMPATVPQHNYVEDDQNVGESIEKLFNRLSVLLFHIDKQMSKILLQGRYLPKKLAQWSTEARALKGRVSDLLKEKEIGKDHYRKRVKLVEMGIEMLNHLKKCPVKDELMYDKPTPVIVLTRKPGINEPSTGYIMANTKFESFGRQVPNLIPWRRSVVAEELKKTNDVENEPISTSESLRAGENEMDAASISKADSDQQSTTEITEKGMMWETKMSSSSTEQETELPKLTEHLQASLSYFDSQQEVKSASCQEIQSVCETTPMEGAKNLSVEKRDIESSSSTTECVSAPVRTDNSHFIPEIYHEDTFESVDMKQETSQPSSNTVLENEHYLVVLKDNHIKLQLDHQTILIGDHPSSSSTTPVVMNLAERDLCELTDKLEYPNPLLLFLQRNNRLTHIHSSFFDGMDGLCFLDLSDSKIRILPGSLFRLSKLQVLMLRNCVCLDKLPTEIGKLRRLEVLDLSGTELYDVPDEIGQLTFLRHMQLSFYGPDDESEYVHLPSTLIPLNIISELKELEVLSIIVHPEDVRWAENATRIIEDIGTLKMLNYLQIYFPEVENFVNFIQMRPSWNEQRLSKFSFIVGHDVKRIVSRVPHGDESKYGQQGQCLRFVNGENIPQVIKTVLMHATAFHLDHHVQIKSLSEFGICNSKALQVCLVSECPNVEMIIDKEISESVLPCLEHLGVYYLWELKQIWRIPPPQGSFCALKYLIVNTCPKLKFIFWETMLQCISNLEELLVEDCASMEKIVEEENDTVNYDAVIILPRLTKIVLKYLPRLVSLGCGLSLLEGKISTYDCPNLDLNSRPRKQGRKKQRKFGGCSICI